MTSVEVRQGSSPIILGLPHTGTDVPPDVWEGLNEEGRLLRDTDWHVDRLYDGLLAGVTTVRAAFHRYVIDANRDPSGQSLYPGQNTTGLIPLTNFDNRPIWKDGAEPNAAEAARRLETFHAPYHAALAAEIARVKALHRIAILYDCHSIRSVCPFLFEGTLPDVNIGTDGGTTCATEIEKVAVHICAGADGFSHVLNGRFRGGWTTRHYGRPDDGIHAIQMELTQRTHLETEEPPFVYDDAKAGTLRTHLGAILERLEALAPTLVPGGPR